LFLKQKKKQQSQVKIFRFNLKGAKAPVFRR
jgi:hypothetical protein